MSDKLVHVHRVNTRIVDLIRKLGDLSVSCNAIITDPRQVRAEYLALGITDVQESFDSVLSSVQTFIDTLQDEPPQRAPAKNGLHIR